MINVDPKNKQMAMKEVNMLRPLSHDGLIRLIEAFDNPVITSANKIDQARQIWLSSKPQISKQFGF
jgi:hypothetical protein